MSTAQSVSAQSVSPEEMQEWLEWAGAKLIATPGRRSGPGTCRVAWPEYAQDTWEVTHFRGQLPLRSAAPARDEIPFVDEILDLPNILPDVLSRRIIRCRALMHPLNHRHLYRWTRIATLLGTKAYHVKRLHARGLELMCRTLPESKIQRIQLFMTQTVRPRADIA